MSTQPFVSIVFVALVFALTAPIANADQGIPQRTTPHAPTGFMLFEEENWYLLADEPGLHVERARAAFLKHESLTAATELRKAAVHLRISSSNAEERTKRSLIHSERELHKTADRIEAGTLKTVEDFDLATARAMHTLSEYQYLKAAEAWRKKEVRQAGLYLRAAADNIERAAARTESRMKAATAEVARDTRVISDALVEGTGVAIEDVGVGIERIGHAIERMGARVVQSPSK